MLTQTFESSSSSAVYTAKLNPATGESSCTCPGWRFKRGDQARGCKHTKLLEAQAGHQADDPHCTCTTCLQAHAAPMAPEAPTIVAEHHVYAVGYNGVDADAFATWVAATGVTVVDVRFSPFGGNPVWRMPVLRQRLNGRYVWLKDLGNTNYKTAGPIALANEPAGLARLRALLATGPIALLCACADRATCHRTGIALTLEGEGYDVADWPDRQPDPPPAPAPPQVRLNHIKPMLASAMTTGRLADYCNDQWVCEVKYDGHRLTVRVDETVTAWSRPRSGKEVLERSLPSYLLDALAYLPAGLYDGELIVPGGHSWDVSALEHAGFLVLVLFDVCEVVGQSVMALDYRTRRSYLELAVAHYTRQAVDGGGSVILSQSGPVSEAAVQAIWARGGEGAILKRVTSTYQPGKRSPDWVKVKKLASAVVTVTGFEAGKSGPYSVTLATTADGRPARIATLDNATMAAIAKDPASFIGRRLVIHYNELTPDGSFRHPMWDHWAGEGE